MIGEFVNTQEAARLLGLSAGTLKYQLVMQFQHLTEETFPSVERDELMTCVTD